MLSVLYSEAIAKTKVLRFSPVFLLGVLQFQFLHLALTHFGLIEVQFHHFTCGYPAFPAPFVEVTLRSLLCMFGILVQYALIPFWLSIFF